MNNSEEVAFIFDENRSEAQIILSEDSIANSERQRSNATIVGHAITIVKGRPATKPIQTTLRGRLELSIDDASQRRSLNVGQIVDRIHHPFNSQVQSLDDEGIDHCF